MPSVYMVIPTTAACRRWLKEHTDGTWLGGALAVEWRYIDGLLAGLQEAGYEKAYRVAS